MNVIVEKFQLDAWIFFQILKWKLPAHEDEVDSQPNIPATRRGQRAQG